MSKRATNAKPLDFRDSFRKSFAKFQARHGLATVNYRALQISHKKPSNLQETK